MIRQERQWRLDRIISELPGFIAERDGYLDYDDVLLALQMCHDMRPSLVSAIRPLYPTPEGRWISVVYLGKGPLVSLIDLLPHGGELRAFNAAGDFTLFVLDNPWVVDERTIILLVSCPDDAVRNSKAWGTRAVTSLLDHEELVRLSITKHTRHQHPRQNQYSYPLKVNGKWRFASTPAARAGMLLVSEIWQAHRQDRRIRLVNASFGHDKHLGYATQFFQSGRGAVRAAQASEKLARLLGLPLDPGPSEAEFSRRIPGTEASFWEYTAAARLAYDPTADVGASPQEWFWRFFPGMASQYTESPLLGPGRPKGYRASEPMSWEAPMTVREADELAAEQTGPMTDHIKPLIDLSFRLPLSAPFVSAVRTLAIPGHGWGTRSPRQLPPDATLSPPMRFRKVCDGPMYAARTNSAAVQMVEENEDLVRNVAGETPFKQAITLGQSIDSVIERWTHSLRRQPISPAGALQFLCEEIAFYGALRVYPNFD